VPPGVGRIGNPPCAKYQICWSITENPREPQLFDIGILFDAAADLKLVGRVFENVASTQLAYRGPGKLTPADVLKDAFDTACIIGMRGSTHGDEYAGLSEGFKKLAAFVYSGFFSLDTAILCAAKTACLVALLSAREDSIGRFEPGLDLASWMVSNPNYSKLNKVNKVKKTSPESFFVSSQYFGARADFRSLRDFGSLNYPNFLR